MDLLQLTMQLMYFYLTRRCIVTSRFDILHWQFNQTAVQTGFASSFQDGNTARNSNILPDLVPKFTCLHTFEPRYFEQFAVETSYMSQF